MTVRCKTNGEAMLHAVRLDWKLGKDEEVRPIQKRKLLRLRPKKKSGLTDKACCSVSRPVLRGFDEDAVSIQSSSNRESA